MGGAAFALSIANARRDARRERMEADRHQPQWDVQCWHERGSPPGTVRLRLINRGFRPVEVDRVCFLASNDTTREERSGPLWRRRTITRIVTQKMHPVGQPPGLPFTTQPGESTAVLLNYLPALQRDYPNNHEHPLHRRVTCFGIDVWDTLRNQRRAIVLTAAPAETTRALGAGPWVPPEPFDYT
jgi:hypothetical protein